MHEVTRRIAHGVGGPTRRAQESEVKGQDFRRTALTKLENLVTK